MAPVPFSGTIPSKRKGELQEIAIALDVSDSGTRDELQARIKKHLEKHQSRYEDDPTFSGLYGKRKKSVQPALSRFVANTGSPDKSLESDDKSPQVIRSSRRIVATIAHPETTPLSDMRDVSVMLKNPPISPQMESTHSPPKLSPKKADQGRPITSTPKADLRIISKSLADSTVESLVRLQTSAQRRTRTTLLTTRAILSDSTNIWLLTALVELLYVLYMVIPWETAELAPLMTGSRSQFRLAIPYPPVQTFLQPSFWTVLLHWSMPTVFIPVILGVLVSFHPANSTSIRIPRVLALDPLSASIARLAAHVVYPFHTLDMTLQGVDVIGYRWRLLTASVVVAFAFAEAIFTAPSAFAESRARLRAGTPRRTVASEDTLIGES
ncbi:hypothetical protein K503DRAFT_791187 [Rhizopogon vinicolor AM-OR11-026]|uniref:SAP domain-containing protein n=1 Tax=Rhizopogon vinicolor AM-OR11-026 TaxID=1314800 RepID=A0A1B7N7A4_9AGAM|nr:hypothetical protein K503DRAFT_791187 [Rhizopogon vinicolor AM-OR11-026]